MYYSLLARPGEPKWNCKLEAAIDHFKITLTFIIYSQIIIFSIIYLSFLFFSAFNMHISHNPELIAG